MQAAEATVSATAEKLKRSEFESAQHMESLHALEKKLERTHTAAAAAESASTGAEGVRAGLESEVALLKQRIIAQVGV